MALITSEPAEVELHRQVDDTPRVVAFGVQHVHVLELVTRVVHLAPLAGVDVDREGIGALEKGHGLELEGDLPRSFEPNVLAEAPGILTEDDMAVGGVEGESHDDIIDRLTGSKADPDRHRFAVADERSGRIRALDLDA